MSDVVKASWIAKLRGPGARLFNAYWRNVMFNSAGFFILSVGLMAFAPSAGSRPISDPAVIPTMATGSIIFGLLMSWLIHLMVKGAKAGGLETRVTRLPTGVDMLKDADDRR